MDFIPYGRQDITDADIDAVVEVLRSDWLTQGPKVTEFETAVARTCGARHAVAVNSATSALHIACLALGLVEGDWLWTSANTFVASANCARYCGAHVDFVDIDPRTYNMSVLALEAKLKQAEQRGTLPKIVIPVHFAGQSCEMEQISHLSNKYGFAIIEDAAHAIGGTYRGEPVGSCRYSDITVFSFHPVKIITTGEGGMALTNNQNLAHRMTRLRSHGITRDPRQMTQKPHGPWYYQQIELGFNYRMTDMQAALGLSQLQRLDGMVARRRELAQRYTQALSVLPIQLPSIREECDSSWHLYVICLQQDMINKKRSDIFAAMQEMGIGVQVHYIPVQSHSFLNYSQVCCNNADQYYQSAITLPLFSALTELQQDRVVSSLKEILQ
jgi:UDP-4-amino-4,6-dideoxy-N-acetyl-beta-L-altrosamine transaminase